MAAHFGFRVRNSCPQLVADALRGQLSGLRERRDKLLAAKPSNVAVYSTLCLTLPGDNQYTTVDFTVHSGNRREKAPK